jgi:predicted transposase YbfD/YdcC
VTSCQNPCCSSMQDACADCRERLGIIHDSDISELVEMLGSVPEFRKPNGIIYELKFILAVCVVGALAGGKNCRELATIAEMLPQPLLAKLGSEWGYFRNRYRYPRKTTIWFVLANVDAAELDRIIGAWLLSQARKERQEDGSFTWVLAMDGKVMRGSWTDENDKVTLFSAMIQREGITIAQVRVPDGTNEITQVKALVNICDIADGETVLATLDAAHSNVATGRLLGGKPGWDYLITVKTDKPSLYRKVARKISPVLSDAPHDIMEESGRGRTKIWSCWVTDAGEIGYPYLGQVACICREIYNRAGHKISKDVALQMTSAGPEKVSAADINRHTREHWGIENISHYVRDTLYREDHNESWKGNGPESIAALHNLALGLLHLKKVKSIKETTELIRMDRMLALTYMAT